MNSIRSKLLLSIGAVVLVFSAVLLYRTYTLSKSNVEKLIQQQLSLALQFDLATRDYVAEKVRPVMYRLVEEGEFIPETMSTSYVARSIFEKVRGQFPDYIIKFSAKNPRNPVNLAGPEEMRMIEHFNDNPGVTKWTGEILMRNKRYLAKFSAMRMEEACLRCHGDPKRAPASLLERYGLTAGFNLELGKVVGLDTIAIPIDRISSLLWSETYRNFAVIGFGLLFLFAAVALVLRFVITSRLSKVAEHFVRAEEQSESAQIDPIEIRGRDEITAMTQSFNRLASKLNDSYRLLEEKVKERTGELIIANEQLKQEIGERERAQEALEKAHDELELRVKERTAELSDTNRLLKLEIEERRRAEEAVRESEERYRALFEGAPDAIFLADPETGEIIDANPAASGLLLRTHEEIVGLHQSRLHPPGTEEYSKEMFEEHVTIARTGRQVSAVENFIVRSDGTERPVEIMARLVNIKGKQALQGVFRDITRRRQAEEALRESEAKFRTMFDLSPQAIALTEMETGRLIEVNDKFCELTGYNREEVVGRTTTQSGFYSEEDRARFIAEMKSSGEVRGLEMDFLVKDGSILNALMFSKPVQILAKTFLINIFHDITERKRAEEALRESGERFKFVIEGSQLGLWDWNLETGEVQRNERWAQMLGYTLKAIKLNVKQWTDLIHPDDRAAAWNSVRDHLEGRTPVHEIEYRMLTKDGKYKWILDRAMIVKRGPGGEPLRMSGTHTDISERKVLEEQLRHAHKMEAVGTLAGGIAHEFNNLLQAIQGYADLLILNMEKDDPNRDDLEEIIRAAARGGELTQQLLAFARKVESKLRPVDLNRKVARVKNLLTKTLPRMINVEVDLADDLKTINADPNQIEQVLMNLAINSQDAMPEGGRLTMKTKKVVLEEEYCHTCSEVLSGEYVLLEVSDSGHGMDEETKRRIFEPFFTSKGLALGTGLGLAMVHGIIENHGGHIMLDSRLGKGTTFRIYLPVIDAEAQAALEESTEDLPGGVETILLVDDEGFIRRLCDRTLSQFGYRVLTASDGESALEIYRKRKDEIDLVILDLIMPGMGGMKCLEELLRADPAAKVLIASGHSSEGPVMEAIKAGAKSFIGKPYNMRDVLYLVRDILDES